MPDHMLDQLPDTDRPRWQDQIRQALTQDPELRLLAVTTLACLLFLGAGGLGQLFGAALWLTNSLYILACISGGYLRVVEGVEAIRERYLDINFLMITAAIGAGVLGRWGEGAILIFLFAFSATLEYYAMGRTRKAIESLLDLKPQTARLLQNGSEQEVPAEDLVAGDLIRVRPGERIPADGIVQAGESAVDQAPITGESMPVDKVHGADVFAGTINGNGSLDIAVARPGTDTLLARIVRFVEEAQSHKARTHRLTDWIDRYYTLIVVGATLAVWLVPPLLLGRDWPSSFYLAMTLLVAASPCALVIATPAAILSAIAAGARGGVLFKGGVTLEDAAQVTLVAMDKTGTLTQARADVTDIVSFSDFVLPRDGLFPHNEVPDPGSPETELLLLTAAVESHSEHPLAAAVRRAAAAHGLPIPVSGSGEALTGRGFQATVGDRLALIGNRRLLTENGIEVTTAQEAEWSTLEDAGKTVTAIAYGGEFLGVVAFQDTVRPEAAAALQRLRALGIDTVMLTGDHDRAAEAIARQVGIETVRADLLPEDKLRIVQELQQTHRVAMVGDGVNDAPALAAAHVGIAMGGGGSDVALETADIALVKDDLEQVAGALELSRRARSIVLQNLGFAAGVIVLLVISAFVTNIPLPLVVVGHEGSTILVALNGLRLLGWRRSEA